MLHGYAKRIFRILAVLIVMALILSSFSFIAFGAEASTTSSAAINTETDTYIDNQLSFMKKLIKYVDKNYVDDVTYEQLINGAYKGMFEALDPYSYYFVDTNNYDGFIQTVDGEYGGVGIAFDSANFCKVVSTMKDSPAEKAGIKTNDVVVSVDGKDITSETIDKVLDMIKGEAGTSVTLGIKREGQAEILTFNLKREIIKISSVSSEMKTPTIGYIKISSFDKDTNLEFKNAFDDLKKAGAKSLIVDLRDNPGGLVTSALATTEQIVPKGPLMHFSKKGQITDTFYSDTKGAQMPVAVLVNGGSASASEIMTGAIKDSKSGTIIGTTTYGKGCAQTSVNLKNGGGMKLTVQYFLTPSGTKIHQVGITPDIVVENKTDADVESAKTKVRGFAPMIEDKKPKFNDKGLNVYGAQQRLDFLGYKNITISGVLDINTWKAIMNFQSSQKLAPYGVLDKTTRDRLDKAVSDYVSKLEKGKDMQLEKAVEVLIK